MNIPRYGSSILIAALITFGLFYLMQFMIATGEKAIGDKVIGYQVEIGQVKRPDDIEVKDRKPEKPQQPEAPPEAPDIPQVDTTKPDASGTDMSFGGKMDLNIA